MPNRKVNQSRACNTLLLKVHVGLLVSRARPKYEHEPYFLMPVGKLLGGKGAKLLPSLTQQLVPRPALRRVRSIRKKVFGGGGAKLRSSPEQPFLPCRDLLLMGGWSEAPHPPLRSSRQGNISCWFSFPRPSNNSPVKICNC